jgi:hypothetical protein
LRYTTISPPIRLNFVAPEFHVATGQVFAAAAVPKAAVHENRYFAARPREVWLAYNGPVLAIALQVRGPKQLAEWEFGRGVSARTDRRHYFGPDFLGYVVHGKFALSVERKASDRPH